MYNEELKEKKEILEQIKKLEKDKKTLTFLYSSKELKLNNAAALAEIIRKHK